MDALTYHQHEYHSPPVSPAFLARHFPSLTTHLTFVNIVWQASVKARHGVYDGQEWSNSALSIIRTLEQAGVSFHITGIQHITQLDGPCVFIANHMSTLETVTLPAIIQPLKPVTFIVKRSLLEYPVFRHVMRARDPIAVDRVNPRDDLKAVLDGGCERLQQGISIIVFPQTTRTPTFDPEQFNTIGVKLAKRAEVPVVPIALRTDAWGNGRWIKEFGKIDPGSAVYYHFGEPFRIQGRGHAEHEQIVAFITDRLAAWQRRDK
jgi:1-acyl-sn-glycerol-3-phosphate acyltransferase